MKPTYDGYVRVSRVKGREGEEFISPKVQAAKIKAWIGMQDGRVGKIVEELDVSGGKKARERELEQLVRRCEAGHSKGIITYRLSRFSRSILDTLETVERLRAVGARFVAVEDGIDTERHGDLLITILAAVAQDERERSRENWRVARSEYEGRGGYLSGRPPTGYLRNGKGGLLPDPAVAPLIKEAFQLRATGANFQQVADLLTDKGVQPSATRNPGWSREGARQLLRNRVYLGEVWSKGQLRRRGAHEPIISPDEFRSAQIKTKTWGNGKRVPKGWLVGLIKCGSCGHSLHVVGNRESPVYMCRGKFATAPTRCPGRAGARVAAVDEYIADLIADDYTGLLDGFGAAVDRYERAVEAVSAAEAELEAYAETADVSRMGEKLFWQGFTKRQKALDKASAVLAETPDPGWGASLDPHIIVAADSEKIVPFGWHTLPVEDVRRHLRLFVQEVVLQKSPVAGRGAPPVGERLTVRWVGQN